MSQKTDGWWGGCDSRCFGCTFVRVLLIDESGQEMERKGNWDLMIAPRSDSDFDCVIFAIADIHPPRKR